MKHARRHPSPPATISPLVGAASLLVGATIALAGCGSTEDSPPAEPDAGGETGLDAEDSGDLPDGFDPDGSEPPPDPCDTMPCFDVCATRLSILEPPPPSTYAITRRVPALPVAGAEFDGGTLTFEGLFLDVFDDTGELAATLPVAAGYPTAFVAGGDAAIVGGRSRTWVVDLADPTTPEVAAIWGPEVTILGATGDRAVVTTGGAYALLDTSDPLQPRELVCIPDLADDGWSFWGQAATAEHIALSGVVWPEGDGGPASTLLYDLRLDDPVADRIDLEVAWEAPSVLVGQRLVVPRDGHTAIYDLSVPGEATEVAQVTRDDVGGSPLGAYAMSGFVLSQNAEHAADVFADPPTFWSVETDGEHADQICRATLRSEGREAVVLLPKHRPGRRYTEADAPDVDCERSGLSNDGAWVRGPEGELLVYTDDEGYGALDWDTGTIPSPIGHLEGQPVGALPGYWVFHAGYGGDWSMPVYDELTLVPIAGDASESLATRTPGRAQSLSVGPDAVWLIAESEERIYDDPRQPPEDWGLFRTDLSDGVELVPVDLPVGLVPVRVVAAEGGAWLLGEDGRVATVGELPALDVALPIDGVPEQRYREFLDVSRQFPAVAGDFGLLVNPSPRTRDQNTLYWVDTSGTIRAHPGASLHPLAFVDSELYVSRTFAPNDAAWGVGGLVVGELVPEGGTFDIEIEERIAGGGWLPGEPLIAPRPGPVMLERLP